MLLMACEQRYIKYIILNPYYIFHIRLVYFVCLCTFQPPMKRILLFPFSLLYGIAVIFRNLCYDWRIFKVHKFKTPVVSVGNLVAGGSGKTPFIEYLIKLISPHYRIATLSRGYGRKTKGFILVSETANASLIGDEPMLYHTKYNNRSEEHTSELQSQ